MNVGIIGSGGREHAICCMLSKSKKVSKIFCFPGNAGTNLIAENVNLNPDNFSELEKHCLEKEIKLIVVGPEKPLVNGIVDHFKGKSIKVFGPDSRPDRDLITSVLKENGEKVRELMQAGDSQGVKKKVKAKKPDEAVPQTSSTGQYRNVHDVISTSKQLDDAAQKIRDFKEKMIRIKGYHFTNSVYMPIRKS